jgi:hypothetical protein
MTDAVFTPESSSPLSSLSGMIGDVIYQSESRIEMRVRLDKHYDKHPSTAIIHCPIECVRFL